MMMHFIFFDGPGIGLNGRSIRGAKGEQRRGDTFLSSADEMGRRRL